MYPRTAAVSIATLIGLASASVDASLIDASKNLEWQSFIDLTPSEFDTRVQQLRAQGLIVTDVDAILLDGRLTFSIVARTNVDERDWKIHRNLSDEMYGAYWQDYVDQGFRPHDVEADVVGGQTLWMGIWVENREKVRTISNREMTLGEFEQLHAERSAGGYRLVDIEVYETGSGRQYAAIWNENRSQIPWATNWEMTREEYLLESKNRASQGQNLLDFESYSTAQGERYAAIWVTFRGLAGERRTELSETQLLNVLGRTRDQGLRLVDLETYAVKGERRYAALLLENNDRFRWSNREAAQQYLESFRAANNAPAASVTVIHNGQVVFQSGSGKADLHEDREANSDTLFLTASVSKTLGGILAVKLSDEDRLQDGTTFNFNVTDRTRSYLENLFYDGNSTEMPRFHQHTIANLLAHRGCVAHYPDPSGDTQTNPATGVTTNTVWTPGINNQTRFYTDALSAAISIWGTNLVTATTTTTTPNPGGAPNTSTTSAPCVIGQNFFYSTPAFTLLGAAMEVATGRNLKQLVNEELFEQFGFERSRVQFTSSQLRPDSNRATPYTGGAGSSRVTSYSDTSWKVLGGGIESTSRELARLGWALLDGQIVDPAARDRWLLNLTTNSSGQLVNDSLGFFAGADPDWRNYFHHGGDATGANAYLRVYPRDDLVIAILANKRALTGNTCNRQRLSDILARATIGGSGTVTDCAGNLVP